MVPPQLKAESRNYRESSASWSSWERRRLRCPCGPPRCRPPAVRTGRLPGAGGSSCPPSVGAAGAAALPGGGPVRVAPRGFLPACLPACRCVEASRGAVFLYVWGFLFRHPPLGLGCCLSLSSSFMGFGVFCACFSTRPGKAQEALKKCPRGCGTAAAGRGPEVARTRGRRGGFAGRPLRTLPSAGAGRRRSPARAGASSGGVPSGYRSGDSLGPGGEGRRGRLGE